MRKRLLSCLALGLLAGAACAAWAPVNIHVFITHLTRIL
jgi:hypothetical protein